MNSNSRRLDVEGAPESAAKPNVKYLDIHKEENAHNALKAREIAREMIKWGRSGKPDIDLSVQEQYRTDGVPPGSVDAELRR